MRFSINAQNRSVPADPLTRAPDISAGTPVYTPSLVFHIIKNLPCRPVPA